MNTELHKQFQSAFDHRRGRYEFDVHVIGEDAPVTKPAVSNTQPRESRGSVSVLQSRKLVVYSIKMFTPEGKSVVHSKTVSYHSAALPDKTVEQAREEIEQYREWFLQPENHEPLGFRYLRPQS